LTVVASGLEYRSPIDLTRFAHESERRFARVLDFYDVPWE
jgi:hypothetical protein